ncbi:MAG: cytochrome c oxidase assembly factor Coa1 family protein, partial [Mesorhizobium sp.]|nr:cytochrome c oxidase assembly factor Coa1 family protein [Mesorhizobium sp.]
SMELINSDEQVKQVLGDDIAAGFWVWGNISVSAGGTGRAELSIPLSGSKGAGSAYVQAVKTGGAWDLLLLVVRADGSNVPIVLRNKNNVQIPNAAIDL